MAKTNGLGANLYLSGYDLSGDVGAVDTIKGSVKTLDVTDISQSAFNRIFGLRDGEISMSVWMDNAALAEHAILKTLPLTDVIVNCLPAGTTLGNPAACIIGKQVNYDWNRAASGALAGKVQVLGNGSPLEWGVTLTAGKRVDTAATNGTAVDGGTYGSALTITAASAANPTVVTITAHGLVTGDSVVITGSDKSALNGSWTVTKTGANTFTVPVDLSGGAATTGSALKSSTDYGWASYLQVFAFTGTDVTMTVQDSMDNSTFANLTSGAHTQITSAPASERISAAAPAIVREYVRVKTTTSGGVTSVTFAVAFIRYPIS